VKRRARMGIGGWIAAATLAAGPGPDAVAETAPSSPSGTASEAGAHRELEASQSAEDILAAQPRDLVDRLMAENILVLEEIQAEGPLRGGIISAYVLFDQPVDRVYRLLAQSARQSEFRPELTRIETVETGPRGPVDEQRLKILFRHYVYRIAYQLFPEHRRIEWNLDERFDNDLARLTGFWALYAMADGRTLGRSGTSVDVGPAVPAILQDWITRKSVPETMKRVRMWVNSGGTYRP
jgi:hypothetical protein